jgi:hypothetical protein
MLKKRQKMKRIKQNPLGGVIIPLIPIALIVTSSGPRGGPIKSKKKYNRKRIQKKIKLWDESENE